MGVMEVACHVPGMCVGLIFVFGGFVIDACMLSLSHAAHWRMQ